MNREIKFRAWDGEEMIFLSSAGIQQFDFEQGFVLSFSVDGYNGFWGHECYYKRKCDYAIMQFAGLKDKNSKEIYEGDIIEIKNRSYRFGDIGKIEWSEDNAGWIVKNDHYSKHQNYSLLNCDIACGCEIKGNIYENPEALNAPVQNKD